MGGVRRRLKRLEEGTSLNGGNPRRISPAKLDAREERERRKRILEGATGANERRISEGLEPIFEIDEDGDVFCAYDGKPVTTSHQTLAEEYYWMEVEWGGDELVHDEEAQVFYAPGEAGGLAVSRDEVDLPRLMGPPRDEASPSEASPG